MPLTANINLSVPPLPDNQVWFANAAGWSNYWKDIQIEATFDPADTTNYVPSPYNVALNFVRMSIDGVDQDMPAYNQHQSLVAQVAALDADYRLFKAAMKTAGFITNS